MTLNQPSAQQNVPPPEAAQSGYNTFSLTSFGKQPKYRQMDMTANATHEEQTRNPLIGLPIQEMPISPGSTLETTKVREIYT
jgi:hypothetical protein